MKTYDDNDDKRNSKQHYSAATSHATRQIKLSNKAPNRHDLFLLHNK